MTSNGSPFISQALIEEVTSLAAERDRLALEAEAQRSEMAERRERAAAELAERRSEWERQQRVDAEAMHKLRTETQASCLITSPASAMRLACLRAPFQYGIPLEG